MLNLVILPYLVKVLRALLILAQDRVLKLQNDAISLVDIGFS